MSQNERNAKLKSAIVNNLMAHNGHYLNPYTVEALWNEIYDSIVEILDAESENKK